VQNFRLRGRSRSGAQPGMNGIGLPFPVSALFLKLSGKAELH
jgi:hypothetical protein